MLELRVHKEIYAGQKSSAKQSVYERVISKRTKTCGNFSRKISNTNCQDHMSKYGRYQNIWASLAAVKAEVTDSVQHF